MKGRIKDCVFVLVGLVLAGYSYAQQFTYVSIDVPCSAFPAGAPCPHSGYALKTVANGINPAGDIVGLYTDGANLSHGFLLSGAQFTTIDVDFSWAKFTNGAYGISSSGEIVGRYTAKPNTSVEPGSAEYCNPAAGTGASCLHGFLYRPRDGKFVTVLFPGHKGAFAQRITPDGDIYGCLHDDDLMTTMFSAVRARSGDLNTSAGGGELSDPTQSLPNSMNNGATPDGKMIIGHYTDMTKHVHGFIVQNGALQQPPVGASCYDMSGMPCYDVLLSTFTQIWDINPRQQFVGTFTDSGGHQHGFLQLPDGSAPIQLDYPGTVTGTIAFGINPDGVIVGQYTVSSYCEDYVDPRTHNCLHTHGFTAVPVTSD
jgi:hypothetical protein